ncbi:MAG: bifunctional phosphopantothenoylcysteine decarboxylase/phosphopantothenate--cysteine ligase CoaBC [Cryomorphaceae bacterium]|jgi:phosphopantothenoylcysteine decarboxylase/phosphopantothenate--cysteine ligase|nr:bifunctional phosphopantothenoylcysteine decarboxylase/phosphopantothenate--cysteine ligase CoaBC [Cryomorphaceae bacterium]MBT3503151.1 bifunctional phosphopantothenoylcysteine decarboxylase/phosphopantothenate--cysteine ligase CoaBC [Cryomorphaceae bacterium]MBT3689226.1 bifunctional phosphopantothenoylcysteine decarboxylase/phosphopantothenate--cysteine ligase CoaBC [Cryomorphaceae bacterium]MBT4222056.1 bifunctional phosphopantothenoylcysteine decarboxylase/phosphopantothenate--cysteine l
MSVLAQKNILIGVSGGIAAYKIPLLIRQLTKLNSNVRVVMTPSSKEFVTPLTLSTLSENDVFSEFTTQKNNNPSWNNHVELAEWADIFIIAPATSNTISSMANAKCDNLLLACYLSSSCPVFVAPAMDLEMFKNNLNQENIKKLKANLTDVLPVGSGSLASGLEGEGRMLEPNEIIQYVENKIKDTLPLNNLNFLITAGPTHEKIDPVRYIGNSSSGKMGYYLAKKAKELGANVILVIGPTNLPMDLLNIKTIRVEDSEEMFNETIKFFESSDVVICSAAISDFKPTEVVQHKIKKEDGLDSIKLEPTVDILKKLGKIKTSQYLVGFALETDNIIDNAKNKLKSKNLDAIVVNKIGDFNPISSDYNQIDFINSSLKITSFEKKLKSDVSNDILNQIIINVKET